MQQELQETLASLAEALTKDEKEQMKGVVAAVTERYKPGSIDPEGFASLVTYDILDRAKSQLVEAYFPETSTSRRMKSMVENYDLMNTILKHLAEDAYGTVACSADYARWALRSYWRFCKDGTLPEMEEGKGASLKPDFGTAEEWMYLCETMLKLCYGHPMEFMSSYTSLLLKGREAHKATERDGEHA